MTAIPPAPANHNASCQSATQPGCRCPCSGIMHQRDILVAAISGPSGELTNFNHELTKLFGSAFTRLDCDPIGDESVRRSSSWRSFAVVGKAKKKSQVEQRVVDVTLRDILAIVYALEPAEKVGWVDFLDSITLTQSWPKTMAEIQKEVGPPDNHSGYFWASMLAATVGLSTGQSAVTDSNISSFPDAVKTRFDQVRFPRARSGNSVKVIKEMANKTVRGIAAGEIAKAWSASTLPDDQKLLVMAVAGSALSADLWRHPAAVRYLLTPAAVSLRTFSTGRAFSLEQRSMLIEDVIYAELGQKWRGGRAW